MIENLESRRLLSASVTNGILTVTGTDHADPLAGEIEWHDCPFGGLQN